MPQRSKQKRPRAYEPLPTPWRFQDLPANHKARHTAIFVVHGMGTQAYYDFAVELRSGFEDGLCEIAEEGQKALPPPFIFEGYWANYSNIEETFPEYWATFTDRERLFFDKLWRKRSMGTFRTAWWFVRQNIRLCSPKTIKDFGWVTGLMVMEMAPLTFVVDVTMSVTSPKVLAEELSDLRIYCEPQGSIEEAIVERIDRRVGEQFLKLLGLDWDFKDLRPHQLPNVSGKPQVFQHVTWVSHSLGTIISYNVVSDILHRMQEQSKAIEIRQSNGQETDEDFRLRQNIERVKKGLHRFFTLGSPLHDIHLLFPDVLRTWSASEEKMLKAGKGTEKWWVNFYHAWDPFSERLKEENFPLAVNRHSKNLWRIPGKAHGDYWRDKDVLKYIISRAYGQALCKWEDPKFLSDRTYLWARGALFILIIVVVFLVLPLAVLWVVFGLGAIWLLRQVISWLKKLF